MKTIVDIIEQKQAGQELSEEDIRQLIDGYNRTEVPDYQMAALLMAIFFQGMSPSETSILLQAMVDSGERLKWSNLDGPVVDKHSTGGVGDKLSLMIAPLLAADGCYVPMISGRGLGHTGGTLDKLESIPGFQTNLTLEQIKKQLPKIGCVMAGQTQELAPVDKKMYALRDVTATVRAIPLITASILSKKLSEGLDGLVIDLKVGNGAFASTIEFAKQLADALFTNATNAKISTRVLLTEMNIPIGQTIGNWLEVREAMEWLQGKDDLPEVTELTLELSSLVLNAVGKGTTGEAKERLIGHWKSGRAMEKWLEIVHSQGGDTSFITKLSKMPTAPVVKVVRSIQDGFLNGAHALAFGKAAVLLGAGRKIVTDKVHPLTGFRFLKKWGERVQRNDPILEIHAIDESIANQVETIITQHLQIDDTPKPMSTWIVERFPS